MNIEKISVRVTESGKTMDVVVLSKHAHRIEVVLGESRVDDIGIGIAQGPHPEIGDGAIWIVVLLAQKR